MSKLKPKNPLKPCASMADLIVQIQNREPRSRSQVTMIDGKPHRVRRGVLVEIPEQWFGHVAHKQTIRKRPSKQGQGPSYTAKVQR
jgi:hypothetical protein